MNREHKTQIPLGGELEIALEELAGDLNFSGYKLPMTAARLARWGWRPRELRHIAQNSKGRIISGKDGYILIEHATQNQINTCRERLRSQAKSMMKREREISKAEKGLYDDSI